MARLSALLSIAIALAAANPHPVIASHSEKPHRTRVVTPVARLETVPVLHAYNSADDPAIWVHPSDPDRSLILGTDRLGGLLVYNMDGTLRQVVSDGSLPNNVDVVYDFPFGDRLVSLAVASCRERKQPGVKVWVIDPVTATLEDVTSDGILPVFHGTPPYGLCGYRSSKTGKHYFFVTNKWGHVEQHELQDDGSGRVTSSVVRGFRIGPSGEGCVADDRLGFLYLSELRVGIWKFGAEPEAGSAGRLIARVGRHGLGADVKGLALYEAGGDKGFLIAASRSSSTFNLYARNDDNDFLLTIDPRAGSVDDVEYPDGIAVTSRRTSTEFPNGLFVVQDLANGSSNPNYKLFAWEDIAAQHLLWRGSWLRRWQPTQAAVEPLTRTRAPMQRRVVAEPEGGAHAAHREGIDHVPRGVLLVSPGNAVRLRELNH